MRNAVLICAVVLVGGCGMRFSASEIDAMRVNALNALSEAERATRALDDGSASGTTMGNELQEALDAAEEAKQEALEAKVEIAMLESRIEAICATAPQLCY